MGVGHEAGAEGRIDDSGRTAALELVLAVAESLRGEFGVSIDAHPGGEGNEAGVVNRAFRAAIRAILGAIVSEDDLAPVAAWALRQAALRRLAEVDVTGRQAEALIDSEPGLGVRWPAYLTLAPAAVIAEAGGSQGTGEV